MFACMRLHNLKADLFADSDTDPSAILFTSAEADTPPQVAGVRDDVARE